MLRITKKQFLLQVRCVIVLTFARLANVKYTGLHILDSGTYRAGFPFYRNSFIDPWAFNSAFLTK